MSHRDPASFRDPSGHVYHVGDRVLRTVTEAGREEYEYVRGTGVLDQLVAQGHVIAGRETSHDALPASSVAPTYVLEHPRIPFVSYPYEWPFSALKDAALLSLRVHLRALEHDVNLSDASAYNVQFVGHRPVFVDYLSFRRYREGEFWYGHRQFCEQFLNPLLLTALTGVPYNGWYRGLLSGIPATQLRPLISWRHKFKWQVFTNVVLQARLESQSLVDEQSHAAIAKRRLPKRALCSLLSSMANWIEQLEPLKRGYSKWKDYSEANSYALAERETKRGLVDAFAAHVRPALLWDLGCNTGEYAEVALGAGASYAVGFDTDPRALDRAHERSRSRDLALLVLHADATNPTPDQGWAQVERAGLARRGPADAVLALALVHHLAIANNVPLDQVVAWILSLAPSGVVEFVPKDDPMVRRMLAGRVDIFPDYTAEAFERHVTARARVVRRERITEAGRMLVWFER